MKAALVGATTVGGMCPLDELFHDALTNTGRHTLCFIHDVHRLPCHQERHGIMEVAAINTACASPANAII
jgi:hypothetical protein